MNAKILKKITERVRFQEKEEDGIKEYLVKRKSLKTDEWEIISRSTRIEKVLGKKHNAWHSQLHHLNLTHSLLRRRKFGKQKFLGIQLN